MNANLNHQFEFKDIYRYTLTNYKHDVSYFQEHTTFIKDRYLGSRATDEEFYVNKSEDQTEKDISLILYIHHIQMAAKTKAKHHESI